MKKTSKSKTVSADDIAEMALRGEDISRFFSGKLKVHPGHKVQRVNVDFTEPMLQELDSLVRDLNISRQAVIKMFLRQCLDQHYLAADKASKRGR